MFDDLLAGFPFVTLADKAVALSLTRSFSTATASF
jgi:hypothetical protein